MSSSGRTGSDTPHVSLEAREILAASGGVELHLESFIWTRLFGYDVTRRHGRGPLGARLFYQLDLPRLLDSGLTSSVWSIATNPLRPRAWKTAALLENIRRLVSAIEAHERCAVVRDGEEHDDALENGMHACWLAIQGGNALGRVEDLDLIPEGLVRRITLVHMSDSHVGGSSNPLGGLAGGSILCNGDNCMVRASRLCTRRLPFCNSLYVQELLLQATDSALFLPLLRLGERLANLRAVDEPLLLETVLVKRPILRYNRARKQA